MHGMLVHGMLMHRHVGEFAFALGGVGLVLWFSFCLFETRRCRFFRYSPSRDVYSRHGVFNAVRPQTEHKAGNNNTMPPRGVRAPINTRSFLRRIARVSRQQREEQGGRRRRRRQGRARREAVTDSDRTGRRRRRRSSGRVGSRAPAGGDEARSGPRLADGPHRWAIR